MKHLKIAILGLAYGLYIMVFNVPALNEYTQLKHTLETTNQANTVDTTPADLGPVFNYGSVYTHNQRSVIETQINGQYVEWQLVVHDVTRFDMNKYAVLTCGTCGVVQAFVTIHPRSLSNNGLLEKLESGSSIKVKGRFDGIGAGYVIINDAILM